MTVRAKYIDTTRTFLPVDPASFPMSLHGAEYGDSPEGRIPVMAYSGANILPTAHGYKSFFGTHTTLTWEGIGTAKPDDFVIFRLQDNTTRIYIMADNGIHMVAQDGTVTQVITLTAPVEPTHYNWSYAVFKNTLYMYQANGDYVYTVEWSDETISTVTPSFLNMAGQEGLFKAGGQLGFWDSENTIALSSVFDPMDFEPSTETLANITTFNGVKGSVTRCVPHNTSFIIYATASIVEVTKDPGNAFGWVQRRVYDSLGVAYYDQITTVKDDSIHYAYSTSGVIKVERGKVDTAAVEVSDFLQRSSLPVYLKGMNGRYLFFELLDSNLLYSIGVPIDSTFEDLKATLTVDGYKALPDGAPLPTLGDVQIATQSEKDDIENEVILDIGGAGDCHKFATQRHYDFVEEYNWIFDNEACEVTEDFTMADPFEVTTAQTSDFFSLQDAAWSNYPERYQAALEAAASSHSSFEITATTHNSNTTLETPGITTTECIALQNVPAYYLPMRQVHFGAFGCWTIRGAFATTKHLAQVTKVEYLEAEEEGTTNLPVTTVSYSTAAILYPSVGSHFCNLILTNPLFASENRLKQAFTEAVTANFSPPTSVAIKTSYVVCTTIDGYTINSVSFQATVDSYIPSSKCGATSTPNTRVDGAGYYVTGVAEGEDVRGYDADEKVCPTVTYKQIKKESRYYEIRDDDVILDTDYEIHSASEKIVAVLYKNDCSEGGIGGYSADTAEELCEQTPEDVFCAPVTAECLGSYPDADFHDDQIVINGHPHDGPIPDSFSPFGVYSPDASYVGGYSPNWEDTDIAIPGGSFTILDGETAPYYPTRYGALVWDTHLEKWGICNTVYKELVDLTALNAPYSFATDENMGCYSTSGDLIQFSHENPYSFITYGKIGYYRLGVTRGNEVIAHFVNPPSGDMYVNMSLDGRSIVAGYIDGKTIDSPTEILYLTHSAKWFNITIDGTFNLSYLEFRGHRGGNR